MSQGLPTLVADKDGNFDSPALRALLEVWDEYEQGVVEADEVRRVVANVEGFAQTQIAQMEAAAQQGHADSNDPQRARILSGFYDHLRGLEKILRGLEEEALDLVDQGFEELQWATNRMVVGYQELADESERLTPRLCARCFHQNSQDVSCCQRCRAMLPSLAPATEKRLLAVAEEHPDEDQAETTPNYIEVAEAHEAWLAGDLTRERFLERLAAVHDRHRAQHEEVAKRYSLAELQDGAVALEALDQLAHSLDLNTAALEAIEVALGADDPEGVQQAMAQLARATIELLRAQKAIG